MASSRVRMILAIALTSLLVLGCDDNPAAPRLGSFTIDPEPNSINAPWQVTGPDGYARSGTGDLVLANMTPGSYAVTWGAVAGWRTPDPATVTQTLAADGAVTFVGAYVAQRGSITVDVLPDSISASWQLEGPDGYLVTGSGDATLPGVRVGAWTITWGTEPGYELPAPETLTLVDNGALVFEAVYVAIYTGLPFPDTADKLMANFQDLYEQMDVDEIRKLLHPDHRTLLQPSTTNWFPELGTTLDIDEELRIHERMFSGQNVTDPLGSLVPGIQAIQFQTFARQGTWSTSPPNDRIPNTQVALYDVVFLFNRGGLYSTMKTQGTIKFYVTHRDSLVGDVIKPYFQMLGQLDLTMDTYALGAAGKSVELTTWGMAKAIFR